METRLKIVLHNNALFLQKIETLCGIHPVPYFKVDWKIFQPGDGWGGVGTCLLSVTGRSALMDRFFFSIFSQLKTCE